MRVLHTLGQVGCKTGTIAAWWMVWHVDSIYETVLHFFEIRCYPNPKYLKASTRSSGEPFTVRTTGMNG